MPPQFSDGPKHNTRPYRNPKFFHIRLTQALQNQRMRSFHVITFKILHIRFVFKLDFSFFQYQTDALHGLQLHRLIGCQQLPQT